MKKLLITLVPLAILLSGCSSDSKKIVDLKLSYIPTSAVPAGSTSYNTQKRIAQASTQMDGSLDTLAKIQMAEHPIASMTTPLSSRKMHMTKRFSINWNGPMLPVMNKIAKYAHYQLRLLGNPPAIPLIVNLNMRHKPLADILRNVQYQVYNRVKIGVYPRTRYIEIRYPK